MSIKIHGHRRSVQLGRVMIQHPENDHWREWREAVSKHGYTFQLAHAARALMELDGLTPECFENFTANLYRSLV